MPNEINLMEEEEIGGYHETPIPEPVEPIELKNETEQRFHVKRIIEALLFATPDPLPFKKICTVLKTVDDFKPEQVRKFILELSEEYADHAFNIEEIAEGYVLRSSPEFSEYLDVLFNNKKVDKVSPTGSEVLAIIAFRQPVTKPQIDDIRGVDSSGVLSTLVERGLVETAGKLDAPGKPTLYRTSDAFLKHYGLQSIEQLPVKEQP